MTKPDNSAFPERAWPSTRGMTYREWLAGQAMAGLLASSVVQTCEKAARNSVMCADALIAELAKEPKK